MKVKYVDGVVSYHLNVIETEELEQTGFAIIENPVTGEEVCFTYLVIDLEKRYQVWTHEGEYAGLKLSYNEKQWEEE